MATCACVFAWLLFCGIFVISVHGQRPPAVTNTDINNEEINTNMVDTMTTANVSDFNNSDMITTTPDVLNTDAAAIVVEEIKNNYLTNEVDPDINKQNNTLVLENNFTELQEAYDTNDFMLPEIWRDFCTVDNTEYYESKFTNKTRLTNIRCHITEQFSGVWDMGDLRDTLRPYNNSKAAFGVDIHCDYGSNLSLCYPMQVNNLYKLLVQGCTIMDFFKEQLSTELATIPDSIRHLEFRSNIVVVSVRRYIKTMKNIKSIKKEFDCIHEDTVEHMTNRNISYDFLMDMDPTEITNFNLIGEKFISDAMKIEYKCDFRHLLVIDQGHTRSRSIYHMDLTTANSYFEELVLYNFSYNYIKSLDDQQLKWSTRFPKLRMFDLSHNEISKIYRFQVPLHTTNRVTTINLQYNNISTISVKNLERFRDIPMMFIDIRNNPIDCNCSESMKELLDYIRAGRHLDISNLSDYSYMGKLKCARPKQLFGRTLESLTNDMVCETKVEYFLVPLICMSAAIVLLCIILVLVLRFRQEITIILFTRFNIIVPCHAREGFDSCKKYDAFVSYSSNEDENVEQMFEDLEQLHDTRAATSFKFCLHHRDFVPGKTIFDNVAASVESSRHTIILLSNHFLKSEYCLYEFQEAFRQSIMEQKRHLIIVMMEDIATDKLPRDLRRCIKTFTYIRRDDFLFSQRLIYALSVKQKSKIVKPKKRKSPKVITTIPDQISVITEHNKPGEVKDTNMNMNGVVKHKQQQQHNTTQQPAQNNQQHATQNKHAQIVAHNSRVDKTPEIGRTGPLNTQHSLAKSRPSISSESQHNIVSVPSQNQLNKSELIEAKANIDPQLTKVIPHSGRANITPGHTSQLNISPTRKLNISPTAEIPQLQHNGGMLEKKLSNDFDRSMSSDTGYGSERGSYCEKLSPEVRMDSNEFSQPVGVNITC